MINSRYILPLLCMLLAITAWAQPRLARPEVYVGVHGGAMMSTVLFSPSVANIDLKQAPLTMNGGLVFRYAGHKVCAIQAELNYMQRGWHEGNGNYDYVRQLDYIEVPLLMHLYFGKKAFRGFFNLGPQIGYCIGDKQTGTPLHPDKPQYLPLEHSFDWGLAAGLGCYVRTKKAGVFQLEARGNFSLGTIYNNRKVDYFSQSNHANVSLNLAYLWQLKIK